MTEAEWIIVYEAGSLIEGQMIQARLQGEGIPARLRYEALHAVIAPVFSPVEVQVPPAWAEAARRVLSEPEGFEG
ncbi:putative signal transducing protein [Thermoflexus hugenholtzii]|uniref:Putative signal transducing protein n=1 Tax=Thermoflexus hugenholtzii JAD2 TaxID=877466 RepID=A0A212PR16_9CHLR|nr:DUF2007 domain-containing protein [Thermoflexus hugenholtzii]SNB49353.1 Putative signal transducing protein [Thermoflexus hugenholtzii JAD2]